MYLKTVSDLKINKVFSANRLLKSPIGINTYRKHRSCWAVALKRYGKTIYTINGTEVLSDSLHAVILPKGSTYSWKCIEAGECLIIEFDGEAECNDFSHFEISDNNPIIKNFHKIEKALNADNPYSRLESLSYLYEIIAFLLKSYETADLYHPQKSKALNPAMKYINENYFDSNITNDFLAKLCNMSVIYFRKSFKQVYGESPIKYLHNFRINKAKSILKSDFGTIEQCALSVGYNSIYHFSKMFKIYTGISPTEYIQGK